MPPVTGIIDAVQAPWFEAGLTGALPFNSERERIIKTCSAHFQSSSAPLTIAALAQEGPMVRRWPLPLGQKEGSRQMLDATLAKRAGSMNRTTVSRVKVWGRPAYLAALGSIAIAVGLLVYLADRDPSKAALIPTVALLAGSNLFGLLGGWLPSFVHTFAFSLFTAAALPERAAPRYGACVAWFAVNLAFEIGQHPQISGRLAEALHGGLGVLPFSRSLANYFLHGTFDPGDIVAALLGALTAGLVLLLMHPRRKVNHAT